MRTNLRRAMAVLFTTLALGTAIASTAGTGPAAAACPFGTNWDGVLKICR